MAGTEITRTKSESALDDVREEFRKSLSEDEKECERLVRNLGNSLSDPQYRNFFRAWVDGLRANAKARTDEETDERVGKALDALARRLESDRKYQTSELLALLGLDATKEPLARLASRDAAPGEPRVWLPSLVGFSLMRVSHHYNEIYYADIVSDLLPQSVREFIKGSVSVPRDEGLWRGSVGRAIQNSAELVPSSLLDPKGVVACEDLIGGNISILMQSVYKDRGAAQARPDKVAAVVFCFLPLPDVFGGDPDPKVLHIFSAAVADRAYSIRSYCEQKDSAGSGARIGKLMRQHHALTEHTNVGTDLVSAIVTPDTQNNPVGAVMGTYLEVKDDEATINSVVICERYLERQKWFPDFLVEQLDDKAAQILPLDLTDDRWGRIDLVFKDAEATTGPELRLPDSLRKPFDSLWNTFKTCPVGINQDDLSAADETKRSWAKKVKIAGDMIGALLDQVMYFVALSVAGGSGEEQVRQSAAKQAKQVAENIKQILDLGKAYGKGTDYDDELTPGWSEQFAADLHRWAGEIKERYGSRLIVIVGNLDKDTGASRGLNAAAFWSDWRRARICSENWKPWLNKLFGMGGKISVPLAELKGTGDGYTLQLPEFCQTLNTKLNIVDSLVINLPILSQQASVPSQQVSGVLRISSVEPLVGYARGKGYDDEPNPIVSLVASFFDSIIRGKKEADDERDILLARYARGASHGFKNALAVPDLVLGNLVEEVSEGLDGMELSYRDDNQLRRLVEATTFIKEEVRYLKEQADLFFWVMDDKKAREDIDKRVEQNERASLKTAVYKAFLRGLYLSARNRLSDGDLMSVLLREEKGEMGNSVGRLRELLGSALVHANNADVNGGLDSVKQYLSNNSLLTLHMPEIPDDRALQMAGVASFVADAVLMELFQNATKAAIVSASEMMGRGDRPFIRVSVETHTGRDVISVTNSACEADLRQLASANTRALNASSRQARAAAEDSGGIKGIWQVRMLCDRLSGGALQLSSQPVISSNAVTYTLTHQPANGGRQPG